VAQNFDDSAGARSPATRDTVKRGAPNEHAIGAERKVFRHVAASTNAAFGQHSRPFTYLFGDSLDDARGAYSEAQLNLHGSTAISRDLEGVYRLLQSKDASQQRR
jgi:hypothetical protein